MPVLKYWDIASGQYLPCAQGPPGPAGGFGVPPQTPPPSGFNSITDAAGNAWVSMNGGAWKQARDVLHCMYYRPTAWSVVAATVTNIALDTAIADPYNLYNPSTAVFTVPLAGWWRLALQLGYAATAAVAQIQTRLAVANPVGNNWVNLSPTNTAQPSSPNLIVQLLLVVGQTVTTQAYCSAAATGMTGVDNTFQASYLGSG